MLFIIFSPAVGYTSVVIGTSTHTYSFPFFAASCIVKPLSNVVPATTGAYIQDEDVDRTKGDISRLSAYFTATRGITTMEEGSLVFPITVTGIKSESKEEEEESEEEETPQYDMNRGFQQIAFSIQRSDKGIFTLNEKM